MKATLLHTVLLGILLGMSSFFYSIEDVVTALRTGNVNQLSRYFDNMVEISLHDKSNSYSKSQAEQILKDFFASYGVKKFEILHKGSSNGSEYCIGSLVTKSGDNSFRTTIFMRTRGDRQVLQEIRFEGK